LIFERLSGDPCKGCAACCKGGRPYTLNLLRSEPGYETIRRSLRSKGARTRELGPYLTKATFDSDRCAQLDADSLCRIHEGKPLVCSAFPFMLSGDGTLVLGTACPPIEDLRLMGIAFLYLEDISLHVSLAARELELYPERLRPMIADRARAGADISVSPSLIGASFESMMELLDLAREDLVPHAGFMEAEGRIIVPIL